MTNKYELTDLQLDQDKNYFWDRDLINQRIKK